MTQEEVIRGNVLIAKFMQLKKKPLAKGLFQEQYQHCFSNQGFNKWINEEMLKFHYSWNWLMPVVRKIVEYACDDDHQDVFLSDEYSSVLETVPMAIVEDTWKVVIEFIKYINDKSNT